MIRAGDLFGAGSAAALAGSAGFPSPGAPRATTGASLAGFDQEDLTGLDAGATITSNVTAASRGASVATHVACVLEHLGIAADARWATGAP